MNLQKLATVVGAAVTTFLLVGAATIEALTAATGADIGPGIVGMFAGVVAGLVAAWLVSARWASVADRGRSALLGYAVFGLTIVFLAFLIYVDTPGVDESLGPQTILAIAAVVALLAAVGRRQLGGAVATG